MYSIYSTSIHSHTCIVNMSHIYTSLTNGLETDKWTRHGTRHTLTQNQYPHWVDDDDDDEDYGRCTQSNQRRSAVDNQAEKTQRRNELMSHDHRRCETESSVCWWIDDSCGGGNKRKQFKTSMYKQRTRNRQVTTCYGLETDKHCILQQTKWRTLTV